MKKREEGVEGVETLETVEIVGREDLTGASVPEVCFICHIDNDAIVVDPTKFSIVTFSNGAEIVRGYCDEHMRIRGL